MTLRESADVADLGLLDSRSWNAMAKLLKLDAIDLIDMAH